MTGLRFLAALHVVLLHMLAGGHLFGLPRVLQRVVDGADLAVDLFFILSGFILTYTYLTADGRGLAGGRARFWVARFARVYPVYALGLLLTIPFLPPALASAGPVISAEALVSVPTLLQGWSADTVTLWNPPAWSLSAEAFFYLLFPMLMPWLARRGGRGLLVAAVVVYLLGLVAPLGFVLAHVSGPLADWWGRFIIFGPAFHLPEFVLGIILGLSFIRQQWGGNRLHRWLRASALVLAPAGVMLYVVAAWSGDSLPRTIVANGLFAPVFGLLIYTLAVDQRGLGRLLSWRPMVLLGEASFALYLLHIPVIWWVDRLAGLLPDNGDWLFSRVWFMPLELCLTIGVSVVAFLYLEKPGRRALRWLLDPARWTAGADPVLSMTTATRVGQPLRIP